MSGPRLEARDAELGARGQRPGQSDGEVRTDLESRLPGAEAWDAMVLVGRIARPHGIRGHVVVNPETDFVEDRFAAGATLWTRSSRGEEALVIESSRVQGGRPVVGFEGCSSIEQAERLAGLELRVPEDRLAPLPAGSYYQHQLVGCEVETVGGIRVGEVSRVDGGLAGSMLTVNGERGEILVPFASEICVEVDVVARRIRIAPPDGLLELNETKREKAPGRGSRGSG